MLVDQSGQPTWCSRVKQANIWQFSFPIIQLPNALSIPNLHFRIIYACSTQNIKDITQKEADKSSDVSENNQ